MEAISAWRWVAVTAVAPVTWGATYWVTREFLPADAPLWGAALRALPAGLLLLLLVRRRPRGAWWWKSFLLGTLNFGGFFVLVYVAAQLLPSSVAASVMALAPVALAGLGWMLLGARPQAIALGGAALGILGVVLIVGWSPAPIPPSGVIASLAALALSSTGAILTTRWRDDTPLLATTAWQLCAGGTLLVIVAVAVEGPVPHVTAATFGAYAFLAVIATALAFLCWFAGLRRLSPAAVGTVGLLNPVTGVVLGATLAGEPLSGLQALGIALVLCGILGGRVPAPRATRSARAGRMRPFRHRTPPSAGDGLGAGSATRRASG